MGVPKKANILVEKFESVHIPWGFQGRSSQIRAQILSPSSISMIFDQVMGYSIFPGLTKIMNCKQKSIIEKSLTYMMIDKIYAQIRDLNPENPNMYEQSSEYEIFG